MFNIKLSKNTFSVKYFIFKVKINAYVAQHDKSNVYALFSSFQKQFETKMQH